jgi:hypothetical protein
MLTIGVFTIGIVVTMLSACSRFFVAYAEAYREEAARGRGAVIAGRAGT